MSSLNMIEVGKWTFQQVLGRHRWGIPSLAFIEEYKKFYGDGLDVFMQENRYTDFNQMISKLSDVFSIQEPDDITALIFPKYPDDYILHDARFNFQSHVSDQLIPSQPSIVRNKMDYESLIGLAQLNRDGPFPNDVVLAGREYCDFMLPKTVAKIDGTRGVYKVLLIGGTNPGSFFVNFQDEVDKVCATANALAKYFIALKSPNDTHLVPDEFLYNGFPCIVYMPNSRSWERCMVITRTTKLNRVMIELVDFGGIITVNRMYLYLMPLKVLELPKQAVCVSLAGVLPKAGHKKFSLSSASRLICFSNPNYKLDCLIFDPKSDNHEELEDSVELPQENGDSGEKTEIKQKRKKPKQRVQYEAIICDRNDEEYDIFLDEILILETYCTRDPDRIKEIEDLRAKFKTALQPIPREISRI